MCISSSEKTEELSDSALLSQINGRSTHSYDNENAPLACSFVYDVPPALHTGKDASEKMIFFLSLTNKNTHTPPEKD